MSIFDRKDSMLSTVAPPRTNSAVLRQSSAHCFLPTNIRFRYAKSKHAINSEKNEKPSLAFVFSE